MLRVQEVKLLLQVLTIRLCLAESCLQGVTLLLQLDALLSCLLGLHLKVFCGSQLHLHLFFSLGTCSDLLLKLAHVEMHQVELFDLLLQLCLCFLELV